MKKYILLFLTAFVFTSGGCGGSSGSLQADSPEENNTITVSAPFDSNGDGVPDVFGYYAEGWSDGGVPYLNYIDSSDTDIDGTFTARIHLTQGHEYVMRYSHSGRPLTESYLDFTILTPDEKVLAFDFGFELDSADKPADEIQTTSSDDEVSELTALYEYVAVSASIDILPPENPCIISYTFTAPQTGIYEFTFQEMDYSQRRMICRMN